MIKQNFANGRNVRLAISSFCNLDCKYCGGHKGYTNEKRGAMEDFRREVINGYHMTLDDIKKVLLELYQIGFRGLTLTGGEPLMNADWYKIVQYAKEIGFTRREVTTNGVLLKKFIKKYGYPTDLTLIKVSFDTTSKQEFKEITGKDDFDKVVESIRLISEMIYTRANRVVLKSELKDLDEYIAFCKSIGFKAINLLDLVYYPNRKVDSEKLYFEKEYVPAGEVKNYLETKHGYTFKRNKYGYESLDENDIKIIIKESRLTLRDEQCDNCPIYCQEGKFTARIATDGNITMCPDYYCENEGINGVEAIKTEQGLLKLKTMFDSLDLAEEKDTFETFIKKYNIKLGEEKCL